MLRYFSRSELGKNCTPIFSPVSDVSIGNTGKTSFYSALWVLGMLFICTMNSQPSGATELTTQSV